MEVPLLNAIINPDLVLFAEQLQLRHRMDPFQIVGQQLDAAAALQCGQNGPVPIRTKLVGQRILKREEMGIAMLNIVKKTFFYKFFQFI